MKKPFTGGVRSLLQVLLVFVGLGLLAIPPVVLAVSGAEWSETLWITLRVVALEAFTLIFVDIATGAFRLFFVRVYKGRLVQRVHAVIAGVGLAAGTAHGSMVLAFGVSGYTTAAVWLGPSVLVLLAAAIATAVARTRLRRSWRWVHRVNYLVFAAVLTHGLLLGYDLRNEVFLKAWFALYAAVVFAGFAYRVTGQLRKARSRA